MFEDGCLEWKYFLHFSIFKLYFLSQEVQGGSPLIEKFVEAKRVLSQTHSKQSCEKEILVKEKRIDNEKELSEVKWTDILKPGFRYII